MTATPVLSVVVPTRNEAGNVEALVERIRVVLAGIQAEVVFVDDSSDDTPAVLQRLVDANRGGPLEVVAEHRPAERQTGLGSAVVEGFKLARGDALAVIDADLQHPPEVLRRLIAAADEEDLDLVVASRYMRGGSDQGLAGPARQLASSFGRRLSQLLFREARKTSDPLSGFFLVRRAAIDGLVFRPIGFKILLEILVCAPEARVGEVPLHFDKRHSGESNASLAQGRAFLRHLVSLMIQVPGSARLWKYGMVGGMGLLLFLGALALGRRLGLSPFQAWAVAFAASLTANWQLNRVFTFRDIASPFSHGRSRPVYLPAALVGGCVNLAVFALLLSQAHAPVMPAGLGGAGVAAVLNYAVHRRLLRRPPRLRTTAGTTESAIQERLSRLLDGAVVVLPASADEDGLQAAFPTASPPLELLRAAEERKPMLLAKATSHLPQPRYNTPLSAWLSAPVLEGRQYLGLLVVHREGRAYTEEELGVALRALRSRARETVPLLRASLQPLPEQRST